MDSIEKLIAIFRRFPTVGSRTAGRFVYYLLKLPKEQLTEITQAISELSRNVKLCARCFNPFEPTSVQGYGTAMGEGELCGICKNNSRNQSLLCVVEKETDLLSLESSGVYKGLYFILGSVINPLQQENNLPRLPALQKRATDTNIQEIILALNPTPEGKATAMTIETELKKLNKPFKITRLARGIPAGGELEYADEETLTSALEGRK